MARRVRSIWERLARESVEGPTVTISLPRELAQELAGVLMGSLEVDGAGEHPEPDEDDFGGAPDGDVDDMDPLAALVGGGDDDMGPEPDLDLDDPAGDDTDDDDEKDEAMDYRRSSGSPSGLRTQTALGERRRRR